MKLESEQRQASKLYIECEKLKEENYQAEKALSKIEEKFRKEKGELTEKIQ